MLLNEYLIGKVITLLFVERARYGVLHLYCCFLTYFVVYGSKSLFGRNNHLGDYNKEIDSPQ